jgi:anthranilate synthase component 2
MKLLMVDNYDSFTYNLVQYFGELGAEVEVFRNDEITVAEIAARKPDRLVVFALGRARRRKRGSPSRRSGTSPGKLPILGVCLGHQSIGAALGGKDRSRAAADARQDLRDHDDTRRRVCRLPEKFTVNRYHSLAIERESFPQSLRVTAWTEDGEIMGVKHRELAIEGVQFHPESILTEHGHAILKNFLEQKA